jgi:hypothetical protein
MSSKNPTRSQLKAIAGRLKAYILVPSIILSVAPLWTGASLAAERSPEEIAKAIEQNKQFDGLALMTGYTVKQTAQCERQSGAVSRSQCAVVLQDIENNGQEATVVMSILDKPTTFDQIDHGFSLKLAPKDGQKLFNMSPTIKKQAANGGPSDEAIAPGLCRQARGAPNSLAICDYLLDDHVLIAALLSPKQSSVDLGHDLTPSEDMERADKAALVGIYLYFAASRPNTSDTAPAVQTLQASPDVDGAKSGSAMLFNSTSDTSAPVAGKVDWQQSGSAAVEMKANGQFETAGLAIDLDVTRNTDRTLPTDQLISIDFKTSSQQVVNVPAVLVRRKGETRGTPLKGVTTRAINNVFVFGASEASKDVAENAGLIADAEWIEVPVGFADGGKGVITLAVNESARDTLERIFAPAQQ